MIFILIQIILLNHWRITIRQLSNCKSRNFTLASKENKSQEKKVILILRKKGKKSGHELQGYGQW